MLSVVTLCLVFCNLSGLLDSFVFPFGLISIGGGAPRLLGHFVSSCGFVLTCVGYLV